MDNSKIFDMASSVNDNRYDIGLYLRVKDARSIYDIDLCNVDDSLHKSDAVRFCDPALGVLNRNLLKQYVREKMNSFVMDVVENYNKDSDGDVELEIITDVQEPNISSGDDLFCLCSIVYTDTVDEKLEMQNIKKIANDLLADKRYIVKDVPLSLGNYSEDSTVTVDCDVCFEISSIVSGRYAL